MRDVFADTTVRSVMKDNPVIVSPDATLSEFVNRIMLHEGVSFVPVVDDGVLLGHMDRTVLSGIDRDNWASTRVGDVFAGLDPAAMISPDMAVTDLMTLIPKTGRRKFMVTRDHTLVGVLTLADLTRHMQTWKMFHPPESKAS